MFFFEEMCDDGYFFYGRRLFLLIIIGESIFDLIIEFFSFKWKVDIVKENLYI